ncbi:Threonine/homoserine/homoserine lactone efflux protein [Streptomyces sp. 1222.5]|uniref:LysE family translocator n=1 Tax=unclassified Streptomyces TaxID=2593676 RepID=UPI00089A48CF|nr:MULTISPECIES: LysE family translocator [unclassified Streptomyces]PKW09290.1 threonine/homoserine/homoserine lactone efflux protein [Streptomyces sp. 5112.2]SEC39430.1 Threonine/homoserine/homoserine lactone efflux protein [Streptomyces sp. 1222.5]
MDSGLLFSFLAVDLLLVCVPGADWAYVIATALRGSSVMRAVAGLVCGYALHTVLATAGLAVLVAGSPRLLTALTVAGAGYLLWLGWSVLRRPAVPGAADAPAPAGRLFLRGATISGANPKGLLLYLSVLPQFLTLDGTHLPVAAQTAALGLLHMACCAVVYLAVGVLARALLSARPAAARAVTRTSGAAMLGIGAFLLVERLATL